MAVLKITCPSCGAGIKIPDPEPDRKVARCPKCCKGFPLAGADEREKEQAASEERERAPAKKRPRQGMVWGFACGRMILPLAAFV